MKMYEYGRMPHLSFEAPDKDSDAMPVALVSGGYYDKNLLYCYSTDKNGRDIKLPPDSSFLLLPSPKKDKREIFYVAGASGSGKSYQARGMAERYKKLFPDREIYLISKLPEDETLDTMKTGKPRRIIVETLETNPIDDISVFTNSLVIFDDYDTFPAPMDKIVQKLIDDIATMGRHHNISMMCLSHYLTNYKRTRLLLNEASHFIVYPQATSHHGLKGLLGNHLGMDADDVKKLRGLGRWVCIHKCFPQYLVSEHYAKMLNQE
jgi:Cdc6-like AAA superfamily ATPase